MAILFIFNFQTSAQGRSAQEVFEGMRGVLSQMCAPASVLRGCFNVSEEGCRSRVSNAFETCLRDQRIKFAGQAEFDLRSSIIAEEGLKSCVLDDYALANKHSYRKTPECEKAVPKNKRDGRRNVADKAKKTGPTAFDDPLENQYDIAGRYALRRKHDERVVSRFEQDLKVRRTCLNDPGKKESHFDCFRRLLAELQITSSSQVLPIVKAGVMAVRKDAQNDPKVSNDLLEVQLLVLENAQLENFHLWNLKTRNDAEKVLLNQMRVEDVKVLNLVMRGLQESLEANLKGQMTLSRVPAGIGEIRMRMNVQKARKWVYPPPL